MHFILPPINSVTNQRKETKSQIKATQTKMDAPPKELPHPSQDQALLIISDIHDTPHIGPKALFHSLEPFFDLTNLQTHIYIYFFLQMHSSCQRWLGKAEGCPKP